MRARSLATLVRLILLVCALFPAVNATAEKKVVSLDGQVRSLDFSKTVPGQLNYQGLLAEAADSSAVTAILEMTFRLYDSETKGTELWSETHPAVEVENGLFQVLLGSVTPFPVGLFDGSTLWLQTEVGPEVLAPRKPLASVAYSQMSENADHAATADWATDTQHAVHADTADFCPGLSAWIVDGDNVYRTAGQVGIGTASPSYTLDVDGTVGATSFYGDGSHLTGISGSADADWTIAGDTVYHQTGPVGINTTAPTAPLTIGAVIGDDILFTSGGNNADIKAQTEFRIGTSSSHPLHLVTNDNFRLTVLSGDGHVGIGTTMPAYKLDVNGDVNATTYYGDGSNLTGISGTTDTDWTISGSNMYSAVSGNVGIGTSGPTSKLQVDGGSGYYAQLGRTDRAVYGVHTGVNSGELGGSYGVFGMDIGSGNYGYLGGSSYGVYGEHDASGNFGRIGGLSEAIYGYNNGNGNSGYIGDGDYGVTGRHGSTSNYGYLGSSQYAVYGYNHESGNSGSFGSTLVGAAGFNDSTGYYGQLGTNDYGVYYSGGISGTKKGGLIVRTHDGPKEMNFHQTTESWCEDFGSGEIFGGRVEIQLADDFRQTVTVNANHPLKVFITPNERIGEWWVEKNSDGFSLVAPDAPDGAQFDYRVVAKRQGYEDLRLMAAPAGYGDHFLYPDIADVPLEHRGRWHSSAPDGGSEQ